MLSLSRSLENPILVPRRANPWEAEAAFNGCPVKRGSDTYLLYRALSGRQLFQGQNLQVSTIGIAKSEDGLKFGEHSQLIFPVEPWEKFGCEDPRVTYLKGKYYIFYTALSDYPFSADSIKVAVATSKNLKTIDAKHLVTPFNAKAMAIFPELFKGRYVALVTVNTDRPPARICWAVFEKESDIWSEDYWKEWYKHLDHFTLPLQRRPQDQVELGAPPVRTKEGWLVVYSYISDYLAARPQFTIEAVLLDLNDPRIVRGRVKHPLLLPEEEYEVYGQVPNIVFPSGALIEKNKFKLFYGAADTVCAAAECNLDDLLKDILEPPKPPPLFVRAKENPILEPVPDHAWEAQAVFNPAAWHDGQRTHLLYRAMSEDNTSVMGYAVTEDGFTIHARAPEPAYVPRESFEAKLVPNGNSGVEDPRLTALGGDLYMCYTAFDGKNPPRIAMTSIGKSDFVNRNWRWKKPILVSPPGVDDKDGAIFPEKIGGKYAFIHRINSGIDINLLDDLAFEKKRWLTEEKVLWPRKGGWDGEKIGLASTPHKLKEGWLLLYHGVSDLDRQYRLGAALLDLNDPKKVLGRTDEPIFSPEEKWEKEGIVPNVVFPCGSVIVNDRLFIYYGGADRVIGVATLELKKILNYLN